MSAAVRGFLSGSGRQSWVKSPALNRTAERQHERANLAHLENADVREESFDLIPRDQPCYDVVSFIAVLHQLPLRPALQAARSLLRPGGRLIIVGLAQETPAGLPWSPVSVFLNAAVGAIRHPRRALATLENMTAPTSEPLETFEQIKAVAREVLPGVKMRRSLFWRYTAAWVAPAVQYAIRAR
jgi:SAM-dependent methyltransferase